MPRRNRASAAPRLTSRTAFERHKQPKQNAPKLLRIGAAAPFGQSGGKDQGNQLGPVICDVVTGTALSSPSRFRVAILRQPQRSGIIRWVPVRPRGSIVDAQLQVPSTPQNPLGEILRGFVYLSLIARFVVGRR